MEYEIKFIEYDSNVGPDREKAAFSREFLLSAKNDEEAKKEFEKFKKRKRPHGTISYGNFCLIKHIKHVEYRMMRVRRESFSVSELARA